MGICAGKYKKKQSQKPTVGMKLLPEEIRLLKLMYEDLASRSKYHQLTRQVFDTFFHLNGLWGIQMFRHFDKSQDGLINFEEFSTSIDLMVKGGFDQRSKILFSFYDADRTNGISYNELVRMLCSYSKEDLKQMLTDQKFLKTIDNLQLTYFFGPEKELQEKNYIEKQEDDEESVRKKQLERVASEYMPSSSEYLQLQEKLKTEFENIRKQRSQRGPIRIKHSNTIGENTGKKQRNSVNRKIGSLASIPSHLRSKFKLTSNITFLVKKYAVYVFECLNLDKNKDEIKFQQFKQIVSHQQKIFNIYFEGFHSYIWLHEPDHFGKLVPHYLQITPWAEEEVRCILYKDGNTNLQQDHKYYLQYIKTTLFVSKKKDGEPIEIKHMEGLQVQSVTNEKRVEKSGEYGYGMTIKHRDGIYQEKEYYFKDEQTQKLWLKMLSEFKANSIYNEYQLLEQIGTGNYSTVYRGIAKNQSDEKGKDNKQVAIKLIEKYKLSASENQVIKFQCHILQLCHHPSIVKFYKQYNTKIRLYIVTEYLQEGNLFDYTKKNTFLQQYEAALVMKQLIEAVDYLNNSLGLIHRDLKPQNVIVITNQMKTDSPTNKNKSTQQRTMITRVKLIDFGFAVYKSNVSNLPKKQKFAGSPGYIAPEVFNLEDYDEGVDMFSLGVIMFFLLSGNLPFHSPIYEDVVEQTKQCNISLSNAHWMNISEQGKDLLLKILTFRQERINTKQALEHKWFKDIEKLKVLRGRNKKHRYI